MRLLYEYEIVALDSLVKREIVKTNDDFIEDDDLQIHEHLRKNLEFYINNYMITMPSKSPRSAYINLRCSKMHTPVSLVEGEHHIFFAYL